MKKWKIDRIISVATLVTSLIALFLVLKKPAPVAQPQPPRQPWPMPSPFRKKCSSWISPRKRDRLRLKCGLVPTK